ncbi:MAG: CoA transferase [Ilumatobacteraceae bacterium]
MWAGPLCGDLLARCGADLVTVESRERPDGSRRQRRFFESLHGRSRSVVVDFRDPGDVDRLRRLLATADVVIEGSRPRALAQLGIDAAALLADGPRVWLSITGYGRARGHRVGFGDDAAAGGGLVAWVDDEPRFVADAVADPVSGISAAAATVQLLGSGGRWLVDVGLALVARSMVGEWVPLDGRSPVAVPVARNDPGAPLPLGAATRRCCGEPASPPQVKKPRTSTTSSVGRCEV